jgi:thioredoxin-like negative regulator of GroEL
VKPYNWAVVVRHELTHAFNLTQTGFLVPIWLTEGLAVRAEGTRRFDSVAATLRDRLDAGTAFDLDTIGRGYHNFGNTQDVLLAYHQGFLYVQYIAATYGEEALAKLLASFQLGLDVNDAIRRACGVERSALERGYRADLRGRVKAAPRADKPMTFPELEAAHKKSPDDPDITARLAAEYARRGKLGEARALADAILAKDQGHAAASLVKARLLLRDKDAAGAKVVLEEAAKANPENVRVLAALGRLQVEAKEPDKAARTYEAIRAHGGAEADVLETLAQLYEMMKKTNALAEILAEVASRQPDNLMTRVRLAKLYAQAGGRPEKAEYWAKEALFVDVMNEEAKSILLTALRAQKKDTEVAAVEARYR